MKHTNATMTKVFGQLL